MRKTLKDISEFFKTNIISTTLEHFTPDSYFINNITQNEAKDGILSFRSLLFFLFDKVANNYEKYDIIINSEQNSDTKIETFVSGYPFLYNLSSFLLHMGIHSTFEVGIDRYLTIDNKKFCSAIKGIKKSMRVEIFQFLKNLGFQFHEINFQDAKFDLSKYETFYISFPQNNLTLTGLKLISQAQVHVAGECYNPETGICSSRMETVFLRCDYHPLENHKLIKQHYNVMECVNALNQDIQMYVEELDNLLIQNGCKCEGENKNFAYTFTYKSKKAKCVICKLYFSILDNSIKINAENINEYSDFIEQMPFDVIETIKNGWNCEKAFDSNACNPKCPGGFRFKMGGFDYMKCRGLNFIFSLDRAVERNLIKQWLQMELSYHNKDE